MNSVAHFALKIHVMMTIEVGYSNPNSICFITTTVKVVHCILELMKVFYFYPMIHRIKKKNLLILPYKISRQILDFDWLRAMSKIFGRNYWEFYYYSWANFIIMRDYFSKFLFFDIFSIWAGDHFFQSPIPGKGLPNMNPSFSPSVGQLHSCKVRIPWIVPKALFSFDL